MANGVIIVDPLGQHIHLLPGISFSENEALEIFDGVAAVIKKPAILIEVKDDGETELYYFRSIGWHRTLLITTRFKNNRREAYKSIMNPSSELLSTLLQRGKQII